MFAPIASLFFLSLSLSLSQFISPFQPVCRSFNLGRNWNDAGCYCFCCCELFSHLLEHTHTHTHTHNHTQLPHLCPYISWSTPLVCRLMNFFTKVGNSCQTHKVNSYTFCVCMCVYLCVKIWLCLYSCRINEPRRIFSYLRRHFPLRFCRIYCSNTSYGNCNWRGN